jgi:hypothetical protein
MKSEPGLNIYLIMLQSLVQEMGALKETMRIITKLLTLWPYETTPVPNLQSHDPAVRPNTCNWYFQSTGIFKKSNKPIRAHARARARTLALALARTHARARAHTHTHARTHTHTHTRAVRNQSP